jgi:precorrin-6Y C5,15-methyltransferase (decarboxylating)
MGVLDACVAALRAGGRPVVSAVTIETQALVIARFGRDGGRLATLSVAEADPVGTFHGWRPAMPVTHWTWVKP